MNEIAIGQNSLLLLFIYSSVTINLLLQCALGVKGAVEARLNSVSSLFAKAIIMVFSIAALWLFFSQFLVYLLPGILIYVLLFPLSSIVYDALEYMVFRHILKRDAQNTCFINFPGGIAAVSLFVCMMLANNFLETLVLSFGFISGILVMNLIIREIRKRAALEAVPVFLRGKPLVFITMGMLSLIFTTASLLLFGMIGVR